MKIGATSMHLRLIRTEGKIKSGAVIYDDTQRMGWRGLDGDEYGITSGQCWLDDRVARIMGLRTCIRTGSYAIDSTGLAERILKM